MLKATATKQHVALNVQVTTGYHYTKDYTKDRSTEPKRANCGQGHTANYRGCMIAVELQRLRDKARKGKQREINSQKSQTRNSKRLNNPAKQKNLNLK